MASKTLRLALKSKHTSCPFTTFVNLTILCSLDRRFDAPISSDEIVEICGASGSGKTYLCLKIAALALLQNETAVIYIDTTNYVNNENMSLVLSVSAKR